MPTLDELLVRVAGDVGGLQALPGQVDRVLKRVQTSANRTLSGIPGGSGQHFDKTVDRWRESTGRFTSQAQKSQGAVFGLSRGISNLVAQGATLTATFSAPIFLLGRASVGAAVELDTLKRSLAAVAVQGENTEHTFLRLRDIARLPGLGIPEAVQGSVNLRAAGLAADTAERSLKAFGNAIATTGGGAAELQRVTAQLAQMASAGKVLTADLRPILQTAPAVAQAMQRAFGTISAEAINGLGLSTDQFLEKLLTELEQLPQVTSGPKVAIENIKDSLFLLGATVGSAVLPPIERLATVVEPVAERLAAAFEKLPASVQLGGIAFAGLLAAAGPVLLLFSTLTPAIVGFVAAAAAIAAVGTQMASAFQEQVQAASDLTGGFVTTEQIISNLANTFKQQLEPAIQLGVRIFKDLQQGATTVMEDLQAVVGSALDKVSGLWDRNGARIMEVAGAMWGDLVSLTADAYETIKSVVGLGLTILSNFWERYGSTILSVASSVWDAIVQITRTALGILRNTADFFTAFLTGQWGDAFQAIYKITGTVMRGAASLFLRGVDVILGGVEQLLRQLPLIGQATGDAVRRARTAIDSLATRIGNQGGDGINIPVVATVSGIDMAQAEGAGMDVQAAPTAPPGGGAELPGGAGESVEKKLTDAEKRAKSVRELLAQLPRDLAAAAAKGTLFGDQLGAAEERAKLIEQAATRLIELGLNPADARVQRLVSSFGEAAAEASSLERQADISETLSGMEAELLGLTAEAVVFGDTFEVARAKARAIEDAIMELLDKGLKPSSDQVQELAQRFGNAQDAAAEMERQADITGVLSDLTDELALTTGEAAVFGTQLGIAEREVQAIETAMRGLLERGLTPSSAQVEHLRRELELARDAAKEASRVRSVAGAQDQGNAQRRQATSQFGLDGDLLKYAQSQAAAYEQQLQSLLAVEGGLSGDQAAALQARVDQFARMAEVAQIAQQGVQELQGALVEFGVDAATAFAQALAGQQSLATGLAKAVGGVIGSIFDTLGNMLIQVGVTALGVGAGIQAIVTALSTLNPFVAIGAGVALIALGAVVKAGLSNIGKGGASSFSGGGRSGYELGASGPAVRSAAGDRSQTEETLSELRGLREDVRELGNRPVEFTGNPREFRRAQSVADQRGSRVTVNS